MHLKLRRGFKEDYMEVGEKEGGDWIIGSLTSLCALLRVVMAYFQRCVNLDVQKQWTGLS